MKITVKNPTLLQKLALAGYRTKLKASFLELEAALAENNAPIPYFFRSKHTFEDGKMGPLLIFGMNNAWKEHIKTHKWDKSTEAKQTAIGTLKMMGNQLELLLNRGKITPANFKKAIKQNTVLKQYQWTFVEAFPEATEVEEERGLADNGLEATVTALETSFQKLGTQFKQLTAALKKDLPSKEQQQYLLARRKVLKRLKYTIKEWETLVQEEADALPTLPNYATTLKAYQQWSALLAKLKAAKHQQNDELDAIELEEEQLYASALHDIENFNASLAGVLEVDVVESAVAKLSKHLQQWQAMTNNGQQGKLQANFEALQGRYQDILNAWKTLKPLLTEWHQYKEAIEDLQEKGEVIPPSLIDQFLAANERIQTAL